MNVRYDRPEGFSKGASRAAGTPKYLSVCFLLVGLFLFPSCTRTAEVKGVKSAKADIEATVSSVNSGTVKSEKVAELAFGAVGRVSRLNVNLGDRVEEGAVLAELENDDLKTAVVTTGREWQRAEELRRTAGGSLSELDRAKSASDAAKTAYEKSLIRAPFTGIIVELNLEVGQLSQITAVLPRPLIRLIDVEPRYVRAEIDEVDLAKVREAMPARVKILAVRREAFLGKVRKLVPFISSIREQDRTAEIELNVEQEGVLLPAGASADVEIVSEVRKGVLAVPFRTIMGRSEEKYVYVCRDGRIAKRAVEVGIRNFDRAEILRGLEPGEIVILPAEQIRLEDGMQVKLDLQAWP